MTACVSGDGRWPPASRRSSRAWAAQRISMARTRAASSIDVRSFRQPFQPIDTWSSWPPLVEIESIDAGVAWVRSRLTAAAAV